MTEPTNPYPKNTVKADAWQEGYDCTWIGDSTDDQPDWWMEAWEEGYTARPRNDQGDPIS